MTLATLATDLRDELLRTRALGTEEGVGAWTFLVTAHIVIGLGSLRRRTDIARLRARARMDERAGQAVAIWRAAA